MQKRILDFVVFFSYSGFYLGTEVILALGLNDFSRFYSVPMRLALCFLMTLYLLLYKKYNKHSHQNISYHFLYAFWILYVLKVFLMMSNSSLILGREKYEYVFYLLSFCVLPFLFFKEIDIARYNKRILDCFILSGMLLGVVTVYLYSDIILSGKISRLNQAKYLGYDISTINPLLLAYSASLTIGLILFKLIFIPTKSILINAYYYLSLGLSGIMVLLGASRGSILVLASTMLLFYTFGNYKVKKRITYLAAFMISLLIWGALRIGSSIFDRTANISEDVKSGSSSSERIELWTSAWHEFINNPIFGGNIEVGGYYPHNLFLEILMATGIVGFIFFLIPLLKSIKNGIRFAKSDIQYLWILIVLIQGLLHYFFSEALYYAILIFIPMGMLFSKRVIQ